MIRFIQLLLLFALLGCNVIPTQPGSFTLNPMYPTGETRYFVAQGTTALSSLKIIREGGFSTAGPSFNSLEFSGSAPEQLKLIFRSDLSSADELAFLWQAGASLPIGTYDLSLKATAGKQIASIGVKLEVTPCSLGC